MAARRAEDSFAQFDEILEGKLGGDTSPWSNRTYVPDIDLFRQLISIPLSQGESQESGRPAKAFDAWIAHEFRRAGFPADAVWPRTRRPRVLAEGLSKLEDAADRLDAGLAVFEQREEAKKLLRGTPLRRAIRDVQSSLPGTHEAFILGDFYSKQIDVGMSSWQRGPEMLISTKTMFSSYRKNLKNRHEEAVGEVSSLRRRHPMAAMGYVYLVRDNIFEEDGAYAILYDIMNRLRRPGEMFDATMLLVANWDDNDLARGVLGMDEPTDDLSASRFFSDIVNCVTSRTPISEHQEVRLRRDGEPTGGIPDDDAFDLGDDFE